MDGMPRVMVELYIPVRGGEEWLSIPVRAESVFSQYCMHARHGCTLSMTEQVRSMIRNK